MILQTTQGEKLQITNRSADNNFIVDIPNAQLRLPSGDGFTFRSQNPVEGITEITVTNLDANTIRVTVTGDVGLPTVELFDGNEGLILGLTPAATAFITNTETSVSRDAFSPRVGTVYQPIEPVSLYANYSTSFTPVTGIAFDNSTFQPERVGNMRLGLK